MKVNDVKHCLESGILPSPSLSPSPSYEQISSGKSVHTELIEENGESRYKIKDIIGTATFMYTHKHACLHVDALNMGRFLFVRTIE